ncbi:MAG: redoxin domain-containing protein [Terriglobales bacterium]
MKHSTPQLIVRRLVPCIIAMLLTAAPPLLSAAKVGAPAPDFTGAASSGKTVHLSDYRGRYVVLEWHNNGCPFVRKQYDSGNMQRLQKQWTAQGVAWFTILSSAPGKQGYVTASEENDYLAKRQAAPTAALLDPTGDIGHLYDAKTSPHMFVINPQGVVIYDGAIGPRHVRFPAGADGHNKWYGLHHRRDGFCKPALRLRESAAGRRHQRRRCIYSGHCD